MKKITALVLALMMTCLGIIVILAVILASNYL